MRSHISIYSHVHTYTVQRVIFVGANFREKLERSMLEIIFVVRNFVAIQLRMRECVIIMNFDLVRVVRFCKRELERFGIESRMRGYQVSKGIWEASIGEELPYCRGNGEVRASLFKFNIASAFFDHSMKGSL